MLFLLNGNAFPPTEEWKMTFRLVAIRCVYATFEHHLILNSSHNAQIFIRFDLWQWFIFGFWWFFYRRCCAWPLVKISRVWTGTNIHECICVCVPAGRKQSALMMITITNLTDARFDSSDWLIDWSTDRRNRHELAARAIRSIGTMAPRVVRCWLPARPAVVAVSRFDNHLVRQQQQQQLHSPRPFGLKPQQTTHGKRPRDRGPRNACVMCCLPVCMAHSAGKQKRRWCRRRHLRSVQRNPEQQPNLSAI